MMVLRVILIITLLQGMNVLNSQANILRDKRQRRMVGGRDVNAEDWKFLVSLTFSQPFARWKICSATVIHEFWLITAAHCVDDIERQPEYLQINARPKHRSANETSNTMVFGVKKIIIHPLHSIIKQVSMVSTFSWDYDIALIKLNKSITNQHKTVAIPVEESEVKDCRSAGWGSKTELQSLTDVGRKNYQISKYLQEIRVPLVPWSQCHDFYTKNHKQFAAANYHVVCGGAVGFEAEYREGGCIGDSGSPLVCKSAKGVILHGLMLGGNPFCLQGIDFMIFTKISHFRPWIHRQINRYAH